MANGIEISLKFNDNKEPIIINDAEVIKKIPFLERSAVIENPNWETTGVKLVLPVPFSKTAGEFFFAHVSSYIPVDPETRDAKLDNYKEANELDLDELKVIIELASFMECESFMHCIGFVTARKLEERPLDEIADFFGHQVDPMENFFEEADGWVHQPLEKKKTKAEVLADFEKDMEELRREKAGPADVGSISKKLGEQEIEEKADGSAEPPKEVDEKK